MWLLVAALSAIVVVPIAAWLIKQRIRAAQTTEALQREYAAYAIGHGRYVELPGEDALRIFADRIERIAEGSGADASSSSAAAASSVSVGATSSPSPSRSGTTIGTALDDHSPIDVFFSSPSSGISRDWVIEFRPLFVHWLSEILGRDVSTFSPVFQPAAGERWADVVVDQAIGRARTAIVILSRRKSPQGRRELTTLFERLPPNRIFPLRLESIRPEDVPPELNRIQWTDFSDVAYVGEGFAKSERYIEFQDRVRALAKQVASAIEKGGPDALRRDLPHDRI